MLNHISIMGRLTKNPELRRTGSGIPVVSFGIAVNRDYGGETDFFDCVAFKQSAEFVDSYFSKGKDIVISGHLQTRSWEARDGSKRKATEIVVEHAYFAGKKEEDNKYETKPDLSPDPGWDEVDDNGHLPF